MGIGWSPEQISLRLPIDHKGQTISHEAIYQFVYAQVKRGGNGKVRDGCEDLRQYLPRRNTRRQRKGFRQAQRAERPILPSIDSRPAIVNQRKRVGDWEDDTIVSRQSADRLKTINERVSGIVVQAMEHSLQSINCNLASSTSRLPCFNLASMNFINVSTCSCFLILLAVANRLLCLRKYACHFSVISYAFFGFFFHSA